MREVSNRPCVDFSGGNRVVTLLFSAKGPVLSREPGTQLNVATQVTGRALLYPETGKINLIFRANVDLYIGNQRYGSCEKPIDILFKLFDERGCLLESLSVTYVKDGDHDNVFSVDKRILLQTKQILASVKYS